MRMFGQNNVSKVRVVKRTQRHVFDIMPSFRVYYGFMLWT